MPPAVLIVDDSPAFRAIARALLEDGGFVVSEAGTAAQGLVAERALRPDCVLLDVYLPDADGFAIATILAGEDDPPAIVLTSSHDASDLEPLLRHTPARGFIAKESLSAVALEELLR